MLVIFGSQNKLREINAFDFLPENCPHCGKSLKIMELTRWFTLFFLPLIKTETIGYYYYCHTCNIEFSSTDFKQPKYN